MSTSDRTTHSITHRAAAVRECLRALRQEHLTRSLAVIRQQFPEVVTDAERFVAITPWMPWDFTSAFADGEVGTLREKYTVPAGRHRPHEEDVPALTDLFCHTCELLEQLAGRERTR